MPNSGVSNRLQETDESPQSTDISTQSANWPNSETVATDINKPAPALIVDAAKRGENVSSIALRLLTPKVVVEQSLERSRFNEQTKYLTQRRLVMVFVGCALVNFGAFLDQTSLATAHVVVGRALNARDNATWITGAYFVTSTGFQLLYGRLSDVVSRKVLLLCCIAIFFIGSLASSLADTAMQLIIFRAVTGIGGGGLVTGSQMVVSDVVPLRDRGKYQGILASAMAVANAVGPLLGGYLASQSSQSWRWIFRLNVFLTIIMVLAVTFFMPLRRVHGSWKKKLKAIDFFGAFLALAASIVLTLGFTWAGGQYPWLSVQIITTLAVGTLTSVFFVLWQWKIAPLPLIPLHMFKSRLICGACMTMFIHGWIFMVQMFYIPVLYQVIYGYSAAKAALLLLPVTLAQPLCGTISGFMTSWTGRYKESMCFGWAMWSIGLGLFSTISKGSSLAARIGYALLTGFGAGLTLQTSLVAMQAGVERKNMAVVTSFRNFIRNFGSTLGLAITATLIEALMLGYRNAFKIVFITLAGLGVLAFFLALTLIPQVNLRRPDDYKFIDKKEESLVRN
ncbi:MFS general substrate transporter [Paraphoma chrysanthemicola]|uniref:MFS general substrate transporter n=1 Tax=Paraphoma chrysanthemicola TaxID=798071 RepID=A0A8K0W3T4_9PLEO|nr:MFS general substrate transporter [Paraphoma chrysanthemicola]